MKEKLDALFAKAHADGEDPEFEEIWNRLLVPAPIRPLRICVDNWMNEKPVETEPRAAKLDFNKDHPISRPSATSRHANSALLDQKCAKDRKPDGNTTAATTEKARPTDSATDDQGPPPSFVRHCRMWATTSTSPRADDRSFHHRPVKL